MIKALVAPIALLTFALLAGCGSSDPMVGTWKLELSEDMKKLAQGKDTGQVTMTFKEDKTVTMTSALGGQSESATGTYSLTEKTLKVKMALTAKNSAPAQEQTYTLAEDMKSFPMSILGKMVKQ
jgi:Lipocalin-like domain